MKMMYKDEDIIFEDEYDMVTSYLSDTCIMIYVYKRDMDGSESGWSLYDDFMISLKEFNNIKDQLSFIMAKYVRKTCSAEAIDGRI